jgi:hypothetical protein
LQIPGFDARITTTGIAVRRFHYSADARKRPGTPEGDAWVREEARAYPMGQDDPRWHKEMEIKYGALGGSFLFPRWEQWKAMRTIIIPPFDPVGYRIYGSYDHGYNSPACFLVHGMNSDGIITTLWEFYADHVPAHQIAEIIKGNPVRTQDGRLFPGNPYAHRESFIVADPSIWAEDNPQHNGPNKSTAAIFRDCGVSFSEGERGGDITVAEWLHGHFWKDPKAPLYRITSNCEKLIWELGSLRHKEYSAQVAVSRNVQEELVDKDNHAWDALKYFLRRFPPKPKLKLAEKQPNTFQWWRKSVQRSADAGRRPTFKVGIPLP